MISSEAAQKAGSRHFADFLLRRWTYFAALRKEFGFQGNDVTALVGTKRQFCL